MLGTAKRKWMDKKIATPKGPGRILSFIPLLNANLFECQVPYISELSAFSAAKSGGRVVVVPRRREIQRWGLGLSGAEGNHTPAHQPKKS